MAVKKGRLFLIVLLLGAVGLIIAGALSQAVPEKTVLELTLGTPVAEEDWPDFGARFWEGDVVVFRDLLEALDRAKRDDRVAGVSLEVSSNAGMNFGKMQELRAKLGELTAAGKFCTAYLEEGSNVTYYLASACPEVYLTPTSSLFLTGLMGQSTFVRGTLDKLHIYPDMYHIAEYKTAANLLTEKKFTAAHKEMVTDLVTGWQQQLVAGIAAGRKLEPAAVEQILRGGPYLAEEALAKKLIDKLLYYDQYRDLLKSKAGGDKLNTIGLKEYLSRSRSPRGPKLALVYATGAIVSGKSGYNPSIGRYMGSDTVAEALRAARKDDSVKAIIFRVDSGGGSAIASEIIRREVVLAREKKPVVVSMSDVAGSGGYWIAMSANKIVADPGTLTGSIGVVFGKLNVKGFYEDWLGMTKDYVTLAPNATLFYEFENFTPEQRVVVMKFMRDIYDTFLDGVSKGRGLPVERVDSIGKGRVYLGARAKELGLVDELGGFDKAVAVAKQLANIPADESVQFVIYPRPKTPFQQLTEWMQVRSVGGTPPRAWLDPTRSRLWKERALVLVPFELEPR